MFATLTDNGRYMVGMTYWRKGGEEPPRRADETGGEGVARQICRGVIYMRPWRRRDAISTEAVGRATPSRWSRTRRVCFGGMRCDGEKDGSDPILTRRHFAERLDGTGKM